MLRAGLIWSFGLVAIAAAAALWAGQAIPETAQVPMHWGVTGDPDRFAGKAEAVTTLWGLTAGAAALAALFAAAPMVDPLGGNLRRSPTPYLIGWVSCLGVLAGIAWLIALSGAGVIDGGALVIPRAIVSAVCVQLLLVGNFLGKVRPNSVLGVRTPWTLTSDIAWDKTHRLAGRLFVAAGLAGLIAAWVAPPAVMAVALTAGVTACSIGAIAASYVYWRAAPDKRRPTEPA